MNSFLTATAALLVSASVALAAPEIGKPAPDFTVKDTNGKEITLSLLKGNIVVLEWTNPGCPFVKKYYGGGDMQELQAQFTGKGVKWLRVNSSAPGKEGNQTPEAANNLATEQGARATATILDPKGTLGHLYGAKTTPHMFIVNKEGNMAYMGAIDGIRSPDPEDIPEAEAHVKVALQSLLAGEAIKTPVTQPYGCGVKY